MFLPPGKAMHLRAMCAVGTLRNYFVFARSVVTWQSPGRDTMLKSK